MINWNYLVRCSGVADKSFLAAVVSYSFCIPESTCVEVEEWMDFHTEGDQYSNTRLRGMSTIY
jgi:hypothetical protein